MPAEKGQTFGDYEVLGQLGAGGMGRVYKVRNVISNREEAMKVLLPDFAADPELASRFMAEIRTLATLEHPNIAQLRTAFQYQNQFVMVMEFVEGITLEKLASQVRIPLDRALDYASQVLAALGYAHSRGVTHRDIKPANIMITTHQLVKLMDFGIAKSKEDMQLTRPGTTMGSVYYMAPEQVRGGTVDARSDLYSLGVTLYEVLTGRRPFQADTSYSVLEAQLNQPPIPPKDVNPDVPAALNAIVLKAMEKKPEDRFQTAEEFRAALKSVLVGSGAGASASAAAGAAVPAAAPVSAQAPAVPVAPQAARETPVAAPPAAAVPAFQPVPTPPGPPPRTSGTGMRGLWIALGATLGLVVLAAVALIVPRFLSTHASQKAAGTPAAPAATDSAAVTPASNPAPAPNATQPSAAPLSAPTESAAVPSAPAQSAAASPIAPAGSSKQRAAYVPRQAAVANSAVSAQNAQPAATPAAQPAAPPPGPSPKEIREARDRYSQLQARADAATSSVEQLRAQQQAQGVGLRGDIAAAVRSMQNDLNEAQQYLGRNDIATANEYMDRADREISVVEKFLGR